MALKGIIPVTITPMNEDGSPDYKGHQRYIEFLLKHPIGGLWALGSAGESFLMTYENRLKTARMLTEIVDGRTPILMGAADGAMDNIFRFFDDTGQLALDSYHVIPHDSHMNDAAVLRYYTTLADRAPKPLWLYHNVWHGPALSLETVKQLAQHPNIQGLKAGGFHIGELSKFAALDSEDLQVLGAGGGQTVQLLAMGLRGHTASPASCFPDKLCEIFSLWDTGRANEAARCQVRFNRLWSRIPVAPENSESSAHEKAILEVLGICKRHVGGHYRPMNDDEMAIIRKVLSEEGYI